MSRAGFGRSAAHSILLESTLPLNKTAMLKLVRSDSDNRDFIQLVKHLDADLAQRDGIEHSFYTQFNTIDKIKYVVIAYEDDTPIACGAIKEFDPHIMEIKRMYTSPKKRSNSEAARD